MSEINENFDVADITEYGVADLTDGVINQLSTDALVHWLDRAGAVYATRKTVAQVNLTSEVVNKTSALAKIDALYAVLADAYKSRDPRVEHNYRALELTVVQDADDMRSSLRYARAQKIKAREDEAAEGVES